MNTPSTSRNTLHILDLTNVVLAFCFKMSYTAEKIHISSGKWSKINILDVDVMEKNILSQIFAEKNILTNFLLLAPPLEVLMVAP